MKMLLVCFSVSIFCMTASAEGNQQTGNVINVNVGKGCCAANPCKQKTKVVTKIVEKVVEKEVKVPFMVEVEKPYPVKVEVEKRVTVIKRVYKKNHLSLLAGVGPTRIDKPQNDRVDLLRGPVGGLMYQRSFSESCSGGLQLQTNQSVLAVGTWDF